MLFAITSTMTWTWVCWEVRSLPEVFSSHGRAAVPLLAFKCLRLIYDASALNTCMAHTYWWEYWAKTWRSIRSNFLIFYRHHPSDGYLIVTGIAQRTNPAHCTYILSATETLSLAVLDWGWVLELPCTSESSPWNVHWQWSTGFSKVINAHSCG